MIQSCICRLICLHLILLLSGSSGAGDDKRDMPAREAAERFGKAFIAGDLPAIMKSVDAPFCLDAREIIADTAKVEEIFRKLIAQRRDLPTARFHVRKIATLAEFRKSKKSPPTRGVSLGEVLGKGGLVVFAEVEMNGRMQSMWIGVRLSKGQGKVVGIVD